MGRAARSNPTAQAVRRREIARRDKPATRPIFRRDEFAEWWAKFLTRVGAKKAAS